MSMCPELGTLIFDSGKMDICYPITSICPVTFDKGGLTYHIACYMNFNHILRYLQSVIWWVVIICWFLAVGYGLAFCAFAKSKKEKISRNALATIAKLSIGLSAADFVEAIFD